MASPLDADLELLHLVIVGDDIDGRLWCWDPSASGIVVVNGFDIGESVDFTERLHRHSEAPASTAASTGRTGRVR